MSAVLKEPAYPTATVTAWDIDFTCSYDYFPGEAPVLWPADRAYPGEPAYTSIFDCFVGGVNVYEMLTEAQITRIEDAITEQVNDR